MAQAKKYTVEQGDHQHIFDKEETTVSRKKNRRKKSKRLKWIPLEHRREYQDNIE